MLLNLLNLGGGELIIIAIVYIIIPIVFILILRLIGAWIFRINDLINLQKEILHELKKLNSKD